MTPATTITSAPLVDTLVLVLGALYGSCRGVVRAFVGRGSAVQEFRSPAAALTRELLPAWLLHELSYATPDDLRMTFATFTDDGRAVLDLHTLFTEIEQPPEFNPRTGWVVSPEIVSATAERLAAFSIAPSGLVNLGANVLAFWILKEPAALDDLAVRDRVMRLQQAIAERLGGRQDDDVVSLQQSGGRAPGEAPPTQRCSAWDPIRPALRIPGSRNFDRGIDGALVTLEAFDPSQRTTLEDLTAAVAGTSRTKRGRT